VKSGKQESHRTSYQTVGCMSLQNLVKNWLCSGCSSS